MELIDIIITIGAIGMVMFFVDTKKFKEKRAKWPIFSKFWYHLKVSCITLFAVFSAGAITSGMLIDSFFPEQDKNIFSGSPVVVLSFLFWGIQGFWVATGRESPNVILDTDLATSDGRIGWLIEQPIKAGAALVSFLITPAKWLAIAFAAILALVVIYVLSVQLGERLESMSPAKAIIVAGGIIAVAILSVGRKR